MKRRAFRIIDRFHGISSDLIFLTKGEMKIISNSSLFFGEKKKKKKRKERKLEVKIFVFDQTNEEPHKRQREIFADANDAPNYNAISW